MAPAVGSAGGWMPERATSAVGERIGYAITRVWCLSCAPGGVREFQEPIYDDVKDYDISYRCDVCGVDLAPCDHEWSEWRTWFAGGEFRMCDKDGCGRTEHR